jgi:tetratricopeptide (TPR) repeat protein
MWSHMRFEAERAAVERLQNAGRLAEAVAAARTLLLQAQAVERDAYPEAAYDLAMVHWTLGRMLKLSGDAEAALAALTEARTGFTALADAGNTDAARMASVCLTESGDCLMALGRLDDAAAAYETAIALQEQRHNLRDVAVGKGQFGTVRLLQGDYPAALAAYTEARETFAQLNEPASVAVAWHQIGRGHEEAGQYEAAERAYQASLRISVQLGNTAGQASTLNQLGLLYGTMGRLEDAVRFPLQAAEMQATLHDLAGEGRSRNNAATQLIALRRYDEARRELQRAIACQEPFGHAAKPWKTFGILSDLERAVGNTAAATAAATALAEIAQRPNLPAYVPPGLAALQALLAGSRDPALADDPRLAYDDAVDLRLLLDQLGPA